MKNVVFIDVDKLGIGFQENIQELNNLKDNILKLGEESELDIFFTSENPLEKAKYQAALIMHYFNAVAKGNDNIKIGSLLTDDYVTDLGLENKVSLEKNSKSISDKELGALSNIGLNNVNNLVFLSGNFSVSLWFESDCKNTLVLNEGEKEALPIKRVGKDVILLSSSKAGIEGFNDCFNTYYEAKAKVTR